jgi:hypothetical protein
MSRNRPPKCSPLQLIKGKSSRQFPLPHLNTASFQHIVAAGSAVVAARIQLSGRRLGELYDPIDMDPILCRAHDALDAAIDTVFGLGAP